MPDSLSMSRMTRSVRFERCEIGVNCIHAVAPGGALDDPTKASTFRGRLDLERIAEMIVD
jgi:hypothetical protein